MTPTAMEPRVTSLAPQFLVDDRARSIRYYERLGFTFGEPWGGFYAIGRQDLHRHQNEHLDAAAGVDGIEAFFERCVANGATILKPLAPTAWGTEDVYVEDPDGYVICFGGRPTSEG